MALQNDSNTGSGVFINKARIISARSVSNEDIYKNSKPVDVGIEFELEVLEKNLSFHPKLTIAGNIKVTDNGEVSWSSATCVKMALQRLKVKWTTLNDDNSIPSNVLEQCIGKEIYYLQYPGRKDKDGNIKSSNYRNIRLADSLDAKDKLHAEYEKDVNAGYVKPLESDVTFPGTPASTQPDVF